MGLGTSSVWEMKFGIGKGARSHACLQLPINFGLSRFMHDKELYSGPVGFLVRTCL